MKNTMDSKPPALFKIGNLNIADLKTIADEFNTFFTNIGSELAQKIPHSNNDPLNNISNDFPSSFFLLPVTVVELNNCINKLPSKKIRGHDEIDHQLIKDIAPYIVNPLTKIFNWFLESGKVPKDLKISKVIPIYKKMVIHPS
jgi:hypothetical protein